MREQILTGRPFWLVMKTSIPAILGQLAVGLYSFFDLFFVLIPCSFILPSIVNIPNIKWICVPIADIFSAVILCCHKTKKCMDFSYKW